MPGPIQGLPFIFYFSEIVFTVPLRIAEKPRWYVTITPGSFKYTIDP
jgi:hypothetical protein